jgi:hypothetical protein
MRLFPYIEDGRPHALEILVKVCAFVASVMLIAMSSLLAQQQSLADVAKQEEHRRETVGHPSKVYTNGDVRPDTFSLPPAVIQALVAASRERPMSQLLEVEDNDEDVEPPTTFCAEPARDARGRIKRDPAAKRIFLQKLGFQDGRTPTGYVVDHIVPLCLCGLDDPSNMQLQTIEDGKKKDVVEKRACNRSRAQDELTAPERPSVLPSGQTATRPENAVPPESLPTMVPPTIIDGTPRAPARQSCKPEGANGNDARQQAMSNFMRDAGFPGLPPCSPH